MAITFTNRVTGERTKRENLQDIQSGWNMYQEICEEMDWNPEMFAEDVVVKQLISNNK